MILPRFIRFRDAPSYLGMDKDRFNAEVRPWLVEIPIGKQGVAFDRLDLDAWADQYRAREGRPRRESSEGDRAMGRTKTAGLQHDPRSGIWTIDKRVRGYGRLYESTGS